MRIDCATCPGRNRACDGCLMQVLFGPMTRDFGPEGNGEVTDWEMLDAVDVLAATQLISPSVARTTKTLISPGQDGYREEVRPRLRAV